MCRMERVPLARIPRVLVKNVPLFRDKSESPTTLFGGALAHSVGSYQRKVVSNEEDASPTPVVCARCCLLVYIPLSNSRCCRYRRRCRGSGRCRSERRDVLLDNHCWAPVLSLEKVRCDRTTCRQKEVVVWTLASSTFRWLVGSALEVAGDVE